MTSDAVAFSEFELVAERVRNWGKWGESDEIGALNYLTAEGLASAAGLVTEGQAFPLSIPIDSEGVWSGNSMRRNAIHQFVVDGGDSRDLGEQMGAWPQAGAGNQLFPAVWGGRTRFADDTIFMSLQGSTQWDALSHVWYDEQMYNGYAAATVTSRGATRNGIEKAVAKGIAGRGVLLDVARHRGVQSLPPNSPVFAEELDEICAAQGMAIRSGDILLIRTGWWSTFEPGTDGSAWIAGCPGLHWSCADWIHEHEIAAIAADNLAVEVASAEVEDVFLPLHLLCIREMGVIFGEFWDLDALASACAADSRYDVLLVAPPLNIPGAVGSPVTPIALR